jgi:phosphoglycolate phosphatase-like HAD superfamily hydrolase
MPLDIPRVRALCFDVDGTLSDTDDQFVRKLVNGLRWVSFLFPNRDPWPLARRVVMATEAPGNFLFSIPDRLGIDRPLARIGDLIYRLGLGRHSEPFLLIPGAKDALDQLKPHYALSIVTARGPRITQRFLDQFGLSPYFQCVATAQTCRHTKPYPDPIQWTAMQMGVAPTECLVIGDTTVDIRAGKSAGAQTVGVLCGFGEQSDLRQVGADLILASPVELAEILMEKPYNVY